MTKPLKDFPTLDLAGSCYQRLFDDADLAETARRRGRQDVKSCFVWRRAQMTLETGSFSLRSFYTTRSSALDAGCRISAG